MTRTGAGRLALSLFVTVFCAYLPYVWLMPEVTPREAFMKSWPTLPALFPAIWLKAEVSASAASIATWVLPALLVVLFAWMGGRSTRALVVGSTVLTLLSLGNSWFVHLGLQA